MGLPSKKWEALACRGSFLLTSSPGKLEQFFFFLNLEISQPTIQPKLRQLKSSCPSLLSAEVIGVS